MNETSATSETRRRVIITEGDGRSVYRTARQHDAKAEVFLAPVDAMQGSHEFPGVRLVVDPTGAWSVEVLPNGVNGDRRIAASGDLAEMLASNDAVRREAERKNTPDEDDLDD